MTEFDRLLLGLRGVKPSLADGLHGTIEHLRRIPSQSVEAFLAPMLPPAESPATSPLVLPRSGRRIPPVFVMGAGRGEVVRNLAKTIIERGLDTWCVIVETDPRRMLATLLRDDWSSALAADRVRFAVGPDIPSTVRNALPEEPDPLLEPILTSSIRLIRSNALPPAAEIEAAFRREVFTHAESFRNRCQQLGTRRDREEAPLAKKRWRIHASVGDETTALKHLAPSIIRAATSAGHEGIVDLVKATDPFNSSRLSRRAFDVDPDLALSFLKPGRTLAPWRKGMPSIVLVSSNPNLLPIEDFDWSERDLVVLADPSFVPIYRRLGLDPVVRPLATDIHDLAELEQVDPPRCDVLAVGSIPDARQFMPDMPPLLHEELRRLAVTWVANPGASPTGILNSTRIAARSSNDPRLQLALAYEATRLRRIRSVMILAEAGFKVRIHGDQAWGKVVEGTAADGCWHGWLKAGREQSAAFRQAPVTININPFANPQMLNMRSLEVPAAGGLLVTDDRPVLRGSFEVGREVLAFDRVEELPGLVGGILGDRDRRDEMAAAARSRASRDHSWDAWWAWIETELRRRFG